MPQDAGGSDGPGEKPMSSMAAPEAAAAEVALSDKELVSDASVLKTCGTEEVARDSLDILNKALESKRLSLRGRDLIDEAFMRVVKVIGIYSKLKRLMPTRTSVLPVQEVDFSGNPLITCTANPLNGAPEVSARSRQPLELAVQFIRVSTDARVVALEDCGLQGSSHDKDDKVEQEVIRLVKKFGAGKEARYAREVSLAGNKFEAEFAKRIIEAAYWERIRHPDKDQLPKLLLDLRRNRIRNPDRVLDALREGKNAGGSINVCAADASEEKRREALIIVDFGDQVDRSVSPMRVVRQTVIEKRPPDRPRSGARSPAGPGRSPSRRNRGRSPSGGSKRSRSRSRGGSGGRARSRSRSRSRSDRGKKRRGRSRSRKRSASRGRKRSASAASDYSDYSRSPTPRRRRGGGGGGRRRRRGGGDRRGGGGGGRKRRGGGGGGRKRRERRRGKSRAKSHDDSKDKSEDESYSGSAEEAVSRSPSPKRRKGKESGGKKRRKK